MKSEAELKQLAMRALIAGMLASDRARYITGEDPMIAASRAIDDELEQPEAPVIEG